MTNESEIKKTPTRTEPFAWFTLERCLNGLLIASIIQLILALMIYLIASVSFYILLIEAVICISLALFSHYKANTSRRSRIILRVIYIIYITGVVAFGAVAVLMVYSKLSSTGDAETVLMTQTMLWIALAMLVLPALLFLQPVLAVGAKHRHPFDLVFMRIVAIFVFILSILLCVYALEFSLFGDSNLILTSVKYTPVIFGHEFTISINIDNILTRILFCACSAAFVLFSFLVHSKPEHARNNAID